MPISIDNVKQIISDALPGCDIELTDLAGDNDHYQATIYASQFKGLSMVQQHKLVYDAFNGRMGTDLHALCLTTKIKEI
ncbi:MAG: BolA/IbaG family iron-sulfur metabolism protein [Proteobacteria bacterium]|nr:BolA/IbaG family iron-sulfur metabolism protein [Pseudomonadota bacterium]